MNELEMQEFKKALLNEFIHRLNKRCQVPQGWWYLFDLVMEDMGVINDG